MPPGTMELVMLGIEEAIKLEPQIQAELTTLFAKKDATAADWQAARARIQAKKYEDYDPGYKAPA